MAKNERTSSESDYHSENSNDFLLRESHPDRDRDTKRGQRTFVHVLTVLNLLILGITFLVWKTLLFKYQGTLAAQKTVSFYSKFHTRQQNSTVLTNNSTYSRQGHSHRFGWIHQKPHALGWWWKHLNLHPRPKSWGWRRLESYRCRCKPYHNCEFRRSNPPWTRSQCNCQSPNRLGVWQWRLPSTNRRLSWNPLLEYDS